MISPFDSGIECAMLTSSTSNGPTVKRLSSATTLTGMSGAPGSLCGNELHNITRGKRLPSIVCDQQQEPASLIDRFETSDHFLIGKPHPDQSTETCCACEPIGADGREVLAPVPLCQPAQHLG